MSVAIAGALASHWRPAIMAFRAEAEQEGPHQEPQREGVCRPRPRMVATSRAGRGAQPPRRNAQDGRKLGRIHVQRPTRWTGFVSPRAGGELGMDRELRWPVRTQAQGSPRCGSRRGEDPGHYRIDWDE